MARTTGRPVQAAPTATRTLKYKGFNICRMSNGEIRYYRDGEGYYMAEDVPTAKRLIDGVYGASVEQNKPETEPERPAPGPYEGKGHGGYIMGPPDDCKYRCKFDGEAPWWVDACICHGTCTVSHHCATFTEFMAGQRTRIKMQTANKLAEECPHCKAALLSVTDDGITYTYACGTTGDRLSQEYQRACRRRRG